MRRWWPLVTVCFGTFMLLVDVTIVNVALPDMAADLRTSFSSLQWVIDGYALALAALLLGIGSLADLLGHRRVYVAGLAVFAASSLVCGISSSSGVLIAARVVQGIGAAAMFATTFALLNSSYSGRDRGTAYGMWGAVAGASAAIGPVLGGILTEAISWRWIFFVNLPVSVVAIVLCALVFDADRPERGRRVDVPGTLAFTTSAGTLTFGLVNATDQGWTAGLTWSMFVLSAVALAGFVVIERLSSDPMLDLSLLRQAPFVGVLVAALALNFAAFAHFTYSSIWLQSLLGLSPLHAGLVGLPLSVASFGVSAMVGRLLHHRSPGPIIGGGMLLIGLGALLCAWQVHAGSSWPSLVAGYAVIGLGVGLATPTLSSSAMSSVPKERGGMAAGAVNTARQLGFAIGIAVLGSVFARQTAASLRDRGVTGPGGIAHAIAGGQARATLGGTPAGERSGLLTALRAGAAGGLDATYYVAGIVGVVAGLAVLMLVRTRRPATEPAPTAGRVSPAAQDKPSASVRAASDQQSAET